MPKTNNDRLRLISSEDMQELYADSAALYSQLITESLDGGPFVVKVPPYRGSPNDDNRSVQLFYFYNGNFTSITAKFLDNKLKMKFSDKEANRNKEAEFLIAVSSFAYTKSGGDNEVLSIFSMEAA